MAAGGGMSEVQQSAAALRAYLDYFRDLGIHDFYRCGDPAAWPAMQARVEKLHPAPVLTAGEPALPLRFPEAPPAALSAPFPGAAASAGSTTPFLAAPAPSGESDIPRLVSFNDLVPVPGVRVEAATLPAKDKAAALEAVRADIGDCTRCPLAYGGRRKIVFADGDPNARLMFVGEGPGADEDEQGLPFVGKSGQLLNNMIGAMGLRREQVYIANIVKCRPPANRQPEWVEATTCTQFLVRQMDIVQPEFVVALGATAAMYLLGVRQSLASLRGRWHEVRGARAVITYHPAFLLRDPRQKGEAWKDLQTVMAAMGLKGPVKG